GSSDESNGMKHSAGLLMYRMRGEILEVLLVHPGGPFWKNKDAGAWSIPKGEMDPAENPLDAARREFAEELGFAPQGEFLSLGAMKQKGGRRVEGWVFCGDCDTARIRSNMVKIAWPPRSGREIEFPEIDRAEFFGIAEAKRKIIPAQIPF